MLSYISLTSFSTPSSGGLKILVCGSLTDTYNNKFGTKCGPAFPSIDNLIQSLYIVYCTT